MKIVIKKENLSSWLNSIMISLILFSNLVIANAKYLMYTVIIIATTSFYTFIISIMKFKNTKRALLGLPSLWLILCESLIFFYGYFGKYKKDYSLSFHLFSALSIFLILIILYHRFENVVDVVTRASVITIILMSIFIIISDMNNFKLLFSGNFIRMGKTAVGNVNTTAISYVILSIPIMYKLVIEKNKRYIIIGAISLFFMLITGSKKAILSFLIMVFICMLGKAKKNHCMINIFKGIFLISIILLSCYFIPVLNELIWSRLVSMFESLINYNAKNQSSTDIRLTYIITAFTKAWDKPFLGHGWRDFQYTYGYSSLYKTVMYTHCNYTEIIFTFGIFGLVIFYFLPIYIIRFWMKIRKNKESILIVLYFSCLLFIDIGAVTFYDNILGYVCFTIAYILAKKLKKNDVKIKFNNKKYYLERNKI